MNFVKNFILKQKLIGTWRLFREEGKFDQEQGISMVFEANGQLKYVQHLVDGAQIMNLIYKVDGDCLVTDQPSSPNEEKTKFEFETEDVLVLDYAGQKAWFQRC